MFQLNVFCLNKKISNVIAFVCKKNPINEKAIDPIFELLVRVLFNFTKTRVVDQFLEGQGYHHILKKKNCSNWDPIMGSPCYQIIGKISSLPPPAQVVVLEGCTVTFSFCCPTNSFPNNFNIFYRDCCSWENPMRKEPLSEWRHMPEFSRKCDKLQEMHMSQYAQGN